ncbi:hypothetical protein [Daejeonella lutea]|uniref:Uncharacterized protein n=1 Tax=Daejeonella lutea TaxID=572036 RepID=A0A1T5DSV9_9SPHI|nr:hypothetical protein [Daejeonella lutea]SKB74606.1 hypothetical protein SAMN05661099_2561 [Daejeonella lutea]
MSRLNFCHIAFVALFAAIMPLTLTAANGDMDKPLRRELAEVILPMFQDSTARKRPEGKRQEQPEKPPQDVQDERLKEAQRRSIKQVPRSIPKLKPQPVPDRGIRRPPMKAPKKGYGGHRF